MEREKLFDMKETQCPSCSKEQAGRISISRFMGKLNACFRVNDLKEAEKTVEYWEAEARSVGDRCGLLSVLSEQLGLYRRLGKKEKALQAADLCKELLQENAAQGISLGTICVNLATTLCAFGREEEGLSYYDRAAQLLAGQEESYEYAALLNNKSSALCELRRYDEGELCLRKAIEILEKEGRHDGEIALSYLSLAHLTFDRDGEAYEQVEKLVDLAWDYINSSRLTRDENYAFLMSKCAPSFRYFQREMEAYALEETAKEIYGK